MNLPYLLNSLRTWRWYRYYIIVQIVILTSILIYEAVNYGKSVDRTWIRLLELLMTFAFSFEVTLRAIFCWETFYKSRENMLDLILLVIISGLFFSSTRLFQGQFLGYEYSQTFSAFLVGLRYLVQLSRLIHDLTSCRSIRKVAKMIFEFDSHYERI